MLTAHLAQELDAEREFVDGKKAKGKKTFVPRLRGNPRKKNLLPTTTDGRALLPRWAVSSLWLEDHDDQYEYITDAMMPEGLVQADQNEDSGSAAGSPQHSGSRSPSNSRYNHDYAEPTGGTYDSDGYEIDETGQGNDYEEEDNPDYPDY